MSHIGSFAVSENRGLYTPFGHSFEWVSEIPIKDDSTYKDTLIPKVRGGMFIYALSTIHIVATLSTVYDSSYSIHEIWGFDSLVVILIAVQR